MSNKELEQYGKRELWEQILFEPDTFVGGTDIINDSLPIVNSSNNICIKDTDYIPAIGKLFD